jgi:hypothetical protein
VALTTESPKVEEVNDEATFDTASDDVAVILQSQSVVAAKTAVLSISGNCALPLEYVVASTVLVAVVLEVNVSALDVLVVVL